MKRLILVLLLAWPLCASNIYVSQSTGSDTSPGDGTQAHPYQTLAKINGLSCTVLAAGSTVNLMSGDTWAEELAPPCVGTSGNAITYRPYGLGARPKITAGAGLRSLYMKANLAYVRFESLDFSGKYVASTTTGINNIVWDGVLIHGMMLDSDPTGTGMDVSGCVNCMFLNSIIANTYHEGLVLRWGSVFTMRNSMIIGCGTNPLSSATNAYFGIRSVSANTLDVDYSVISGNGRKTISDNINMTGLTLVDGGHNYFQSVPPMTTWPITGAKFNFGFDGDNGVYQYYLDVVATLPPGNHISYVVPATSTTGDAARVANVNAMVAAGVEIGMHGSTHTVWTSPSFFKLTTTNANGTINVNKAAHTLTLHCTTSPACDADIVLDWSSADKTVANLTTAISGKGWTVTQLPTSLNFTYVILATAADTAGAVSVPTGATGYTLPFDVPSFLDFELGRNYTWLTTVLGHPPKIAAPPYGLTNATVNAYLKDTLGISANRIAATGANASQGLASIDLFNIPSRSSVDFFAASATEAAIRTSARAWYVQGMATGAVLTIYAHNSTEASVQQWGWFFDEFSKIGGTLSTFDSIITDIKADHTTADGYIYTKTYTDAMDPRIPKCGLYGHTPCRGGMDTTALTPAGLATCANPKVAGTTLPKALFGNGIGPNCWVRGPVGQ